ncbi:phage antirepressor KilAC domain-containing protein [Clostridium sp.]|uniref:phage antirepressor KilAC domain-containing protein n=1 Tax=Clostridium sp. TaxID=1506 RepID=UPI0037BEA08D
MNLELAKILKQNGVNIGGLRLFNYFRENGYLIKRRGSEYNLPTQRSMDLKLFQIKETIINHGDGKITVSKTAKITGKGQEYFINKFIGERYDDC